MIGEEKIVSSCVSDVKPLTVCHVRVVTKKLLNNLCSSRTTLSH